MLELPHDLVLPDYDGGCVANLPASLVRLFGGQHPSPPLRPELTDGLVDGVRRVVLVIVDSLGLDRLRAALDRNPHSGFHRLLATGRLEALTSTCPSTTTAALTALWCGYPPAQHGLLGYRLFLREFGARSNMITFSPTATERLGREQLLGAGLEPERFLPVPSLPETLAAVDVPVYNLIERPFTQSVLSRVQIRGQRETRGVVTSSDLWVRLREWIQERRADRALFVAYWSAVDDICHAYGPSHEAVLAELDSFAYSLERELLDRLSPWDRAGTLLLLTADHGQVDTPPSEAVWLRDHPELAERILAFAGEPRAAYLYCRQGEAEAVWAYARETLSEQFAALDAREALSAGLFGPPPYAAETPHRIGDVVLLARGPHSLWERATAPDTLGRHGSLTPAEMQVPLLAARLDG